MTWLGAVRSIDCCATMASVSAGDCFPRHVAETLVEPGVRPQRAQGNVFHALGDLDLMDPDGLCAMAEQDLLRLVLALAVAHPHPKIRPRAAAYHSSPLTRSRSK